MADPTGAAADKSPQTQERTGEGRTSDPAKNQTLLVFTLGCKIALHCAARQYTRPQAVGRHPPVGKWLALRCTPIHTPSGRGPPSGWKIACIGPFAKLLN